MLPAQHCRLLLRMPQSSHCAERGHVEGRRVVLRASEAWLPRATQWVGQSQASRPWRAEYLLSSQGVHRGLRPPMPRS